MILDAAKTALAPYLMWVKLAAIVAVIAALLWYRHSLIEQGIKQKTADDAALVAARIIHNTEVETRAKTLADAHIDTYKNTLHDPPATDAPHVSCVSNSRPSAVPTNAGPRPNTDAKTVEPNVVETVPQGSWDLGPDVDKRFHDDDALIAELQYRLGLEVGICR